MRREEFMFDAIQFRKDSTYYYNLKMAEKYHNIIEKMRVQVEQGEYEFVVSARELTQELIYWLNTLDFSFFYIPRGQTIESNHWIMVCDLDLNKCEWIKIKW